MAEGLFEWEEEGRRRKCTCYCCFSITVLVLIVLALALALFLLCFIKPQKPEFSLQSVSIREFELDKQDLPNGMSIVYLSMNVRLVFSAVNSNRVGIEYSPTTLDCKYYGNLLGVANVPSFYQPSHSRTTVEATILVYHLNVMQSVSLNLLHDAAQDRVPLRITGPIKARIRIAGINSPTVQVFIDCLIVVSPREQGLTSKECNVDQVNF